LGGATKIVLELVLVLVLDCHKNLALSLVLGFSWLASRHPAKVIHQKKQFAFLGSEKLTRRNHAAVRSGAQIAAKGPS
jgi:hypothetical protein